MIPSRGGFGEKWLRGTQKPPGRAESPVKQLGGSVRVRRDGDVDDEDALVGNAALKRDGGCLHFEAHQSGSVQSPQCEDDPPARIVSDAKHTAHCTRLRLLLEYVKRRTLLQHAGLSKR